MKKFLSIFTLGLLIGTAGCGHKKVVKHEIVVEDDFNHPTIGDRVGRTFNKVAHRTEELAHKAKDKATEVAHRVSEKMRSCKS